MAQAEGKRAKGAESVARRFGMAILTPVSLQERCAVTKWGNTLDDYQQATAKQIEMMRNTETRIPT